MLCIPDMRIVQLILVDYYTGEKVAQSKFVATSADELNWTDNFMFFQWGNTGRFELRVLRPLFKIKS